MNETLHESRPRMMSVAYRMLGSVVDAGDAVQDAFLRLQVIDDVISPDGFLVKTITWRCIDRFRARRRRVQYFRSRVAGIRRRPREIGQRNRYHVETREVVALVNCQIGPQWESS
jgi:DNA-directed RNA polymerase specialized sigma24 family protein